MKFSATILMLMLILVLFAGCEDEMAPYDDYVSADLNWPTLDPNRYHWDGFTNPFYEGWFYKVTDPASGESFFFIYGVQNPGNEIDEPAGGFVYLKKDDGQSLFTLYPLSAFSASVKECKVKIADTVATEKNIHGVIDNADGQISWDIDLNIATEWTETMGSLTNFPGLPLNWYVNAVNAYATGTINWQGKTYELDQAPAYNDHNWGTVFPDAWIWIQGNGFEDNPDDAFTVAGGPLPVASFEPEAFMMVYKADGELYEFRSLDLNVTFQSELSYEQGTAFIRATKGSFRMEVTATVDPADFLTVRVPTFDGMTPGSRQALDGQFNVKLFEKFESGWTLRKDATTTVGVLELGGSYGGF